MAGEPISTFVGNLTGAPEMRFTPSGVAVANFVLANNPRYFNKQSNQWEEGEALFVRCTAWRELAENATESLDKGMEVIVQGRMKAHSWEDKQTGQKRTGWEVDVDHVGPSLRWATAQVQRVQKGQSQQGGGFGGGQAQQSGWGSQQPAADPWGGVAAGGGSWDTPASGPQDPPF